MVLYHETIDANLQLQSDQMPVKDTPEFRLRVLQGFQGALWSAKVTFRENDYQQILELECRHLEAFLPFGTKCPDLSSHFLKLPRCSIGGGCPIAPLRDLAVERRPRQPVRAQHRRFFGAGFDRIQRGAAPRRRVSAAGPQEYLSHASEALGGLLLVGVKRRPLSEQDQSSWPGVCRELDSSSATWRSSAGCDHADGRGERVVGFVARRNLPRRFAGSQGVLHFFKPSAAGKRCSQI